MKSLTNCEIPSSDPLQNACSDFLIADCVYKVLTKPACDPENCKLFRKPAHDCTLEKIDQ
jgi:hypothetical protein